MRRRIAVISIAITLLSATSVLGAGWWDSTFDSDGFATLSFTNYQDSVYEFAVQGDGKIVAVGESYTGDGTSGNPSNIEWALARFETNGTPDSTFGTGGKVRPTWTTGSDILEDVALQSDGKIVVAGSTGTGGFAVGRFNSDGSPDTSFDSDGLATLGPTDSSAHSVVVQPDQKIVVAGRVRAAVAGATFDVVLARFNSNGSLDNTFGSSGYVTTSLTANDDRPTSLQLQTDGKFVVSAYGGPTSNIDSFVLRYTAVGALDASFSGDGIELLAPGSAADIARDAVIQGDGAILVAGSTDVGSYRDSFVARFTSSGVLDNTFGTNGISILALSDRNDSPMGIALQPDGKIVLGGGLNIVNTGYGFVARLLTDGSLDSSFGCGGFETRLEGTLTSFDDVSMLSGGQIVAAGHANIPVGTGRNFAVAQFDPSIARPTACSGSSTSTTSTSTSTTSTSTTTTTTLASTTSTTVEAVTRSVSTTTAATSSSTTTTVKSSTTSSTVARASSLATSTSTSTTSTSTTTIVPTTTTTPPNSDGPGDTDVPSGEVVVTVGGIPVPATTDDSTGSIVTTVGGGTVTHEVVRPSGENKVLNLDVPTSWEPQETVRVTFDGFAPGSGGAVWIYPDGMVAGTAPLDGGSGSVLVQRPSGISGKDHRIIATAMSKSGDEIAVAYGLTVVTEGSASGWSRWLLIALACAVVAGLLIPAVRRRTGKRPVLAGVDNDVTYVGIYNADGSLLGEISYVLAKYTGRGHCELCDITHGTFRRKRSWDKACEQAGINMELLHRDEATTDQLNAAGNLPAIIKVDGNTWRLVAGPAELAACDGDPERLMTLLTTW